ncbi:DJ-1/PfpI family protein [Methylobacterium sp. Gmos1]
MARLLCELREHSGKVGQVTDGQFELPLRQTDLADTLRMDETAIAFAQSFLDAGKPVATICHGPWTLIETGKLRGRRMAPGPSLQTDLETQGVEWLDQEVVVDGNLVSSRMPDDIPAFNREVVALFGRSRAQGGTTRTVSRAFSDHAQRSPAASAARPSG